MSSLIPGLASHEFNQMVPHQPILVAYRGSIAHGTHVPPEDPTGIDDRDIMGVYVAPLGFYFGLQGGQERGLDVKIREWDCASYELRHYIRLAMNGNPNVLSLLWTPPLMSTPAGDRLIAHRHLFATKAAHASFGGYAMSQMKRMTTISDAISICGCTGEHHETGCSENKALGRGSSKRFATGFMGAKRKALVEKFGYDCKNAAHLIRLLVMGIEFLQTGEVFVDRRALDAGYLMEIKRGEHTLETVQQKARELFADLDVALTESPLPAKPNTILINKLLVELLSDAHAAEATLAKTTMATKRLMEQ